MRTFESEPMQSGILRASRPLERAGSRRRGSPPSSGRGRRRAPCSARRSSSLSSAWVAWTIVVRGPRQPVSCEQLDRPEPVLGQALLDLARLLVGVDVKDEALPRRRRRPISSSQSRGHARTEWGATPTRRRRRAAPPPARGSRRPSPGGSGRARRGRRRPAGGRARRRPPRPPRRPPPPRRSRRSGTRRPRCSRRPASRGSVARSPRGRRSGSRPRRQASIDSRQAQKSPPSTFPRSARWNAWLCALTKPGRGRPSVIAATLPFGPNGHTRRSRTARAAAERAHDPAPSGHPRLRRPPAIARTARGATASRPSSPPRRSPTRSTGSSPGAGTSSRSSGSSPTRSPTGS